MYAIKRWFHISIATTGVIKSQKNVFSLSKNTVGKRKNQKNE